MSQIEFEIPEGYVLDKEANTDSKLIYKKPYNLPRSWNEFVKNKSIVNSYYINSISQIAERAPISALDAEANRNIFFKKDQAQAVLALIQLLNLRDEYKNHDKLLIKSGYSSIVYSEKADKLIVLETTRPTLFSFLNEDLAIKFLDNFRNLLIHALEFVPYYN